MNETTNPLLERARIPGETITLPSLGLFYNDGEVSEDTENGEIYLYPMVTLDEIILKTPDKLFSGEAIETVFKRCSPNILKPLDLLANDVDFILTALRKISFGDTCEVDYTHDCKEGKLHSYNINLSNILKDSKKIDPTNIQREYSKKLTNGQLIKFSPPRFLPTLKIYQAALDESKIEPEQLEKEVVENIAAIIIDVDGITDKKMITDWIRILTPIYMQEVKESIVGVSEWGANFKTTVKCKDCDNDMDISSEVNPINFFF